MARSSQSLLLELVDTEFDDPELAPEILPVDARLSIRTTRTALQYLFERAASIIPTREVIAGTSFTLLEAFAAEEGEAAYMQITATDSENTLVVLNQTHVILAGAALVPAKKVLDIIKLTPEEKIKFEVIGNTATIRSGQAVWTVQTPSGDSLPKLPDVSDVELQPVGTQSFLTALTVTQKAMSKSTARTSMMQVHIKNQLMTGADGARVHRIKLDEFPMDLSMTIPWKVVEELIRALRVSDDDEFEAGANDNLLAFRISSDILLAQRLLTTYPDVDNMILAPKIKNTSSFTVDGDSFAEVVRRVRVNADPEYSGIYLALTQGKSGWNLTVRARDKTGNAAQESLSIEWNGPKGSRELVVNHKHLLDLLTSVEEDVLEFKVGEDTKAKKNSILLESGNFTGVLAQMMDNWH